MKSIRGKCRILRWIFSSSNLPFGPPPPSLFRLSFEPIHGNAERSNKEGIFPDVSGIGKRRKKIKIRIE